MSLLSSHFLISHTSTYNVNIRAFCFSLRVSPSDSHTSKLLSRLDLSHASRGGSHVLSVTDHVSCRVGKHVFQQGQEKHVEPKSGKRIGSNSATIYLYTTLSGSKHLESAMPQWAWGGAERDLFPSNAVISACLHTPVLRETQYKSCQ